MGTHIKEVLVKIFLMRSTLPVTREKTVLDTREKFDVLLTGEPL